MKEKRKMVYKESVWKNKDKGLEGKEEKGNMVKVVEWGSKLSLWMEEGFRANLQSKDKS